MIPRYENKLISAIWDESSKYEYWKQVELAVLQVLVQTKNLDNQIIKELKSVKLDISKILEIEKITRHDVVAFTRYISSLASQELARWLHFGLTSTDVVDTAQSLMIRDTLELINPLIVKLKEVIKKLVNTNIEVLAAGRTHGMVGEPISLSHRFLNWYDMISRTAADFEASVSELCLAKINGSMGNNVHFGIDAEMQVAKNLNLKTTDVSTQVISRDFHLKMFQCASRFGSAIEFVANQIRILHLDGIAEIREGFKPGQKGSSSMPHKKNPIYCENIVGLSRLLKGMCVTADANVQLWLERDISHSSNERIIIPDMFHTVNFMVMRLTDVLENLSIDYAKISSNVQLNLENVYSQFALNKQIEVSFGKRDEIYDRIQSSITKQTPREVDEYNKKIIDVTNQRIKRYFTK